MSNRATLKLFFETGDIPTEAQFADLIDSLLSLDDPNVIGASFTIQSPTASMVEIFIDDNSFDVTTDGFAALTGFLSIFTTSVAMGVGAKQILIDPSIQTIIERDDTLPIIISSNSVKIFDLRNDGVNNRANLSIPTFANDAAAGAGGLTIGDLYQTAAGAMLIKL